MEAEKNEKEIVENSLYVNSINTDPPILTPDMSPT